MRGVVGWVDWQPYREKLSQRNTGSLIENVTLFTCEWERKACDPLLMNVDVSCLGSCWQKKSLL